MEKELRMETEDTNDDNQDVETYMMLRGESRGSCGSHKGILKSSASFDTHTYSSNLDAQSIMQQARKGSVDERGSSSRAADGRSKFLKFANVMDEDEELKSESGSRKLREPLPDPHEILRNTIGISNHEIEREAERRLKEALEHEEDPGEYTAVKLARELLSSFHADDSEEGVIDDADEEETPDPLDGDDTVETVTSMKTIAGDDR